MRPQPTGGGLHFAFIEILVSWSNCRKGEPVGCTVFGMGVKQEPVPRDGVYELYWRFAAERQQVFERRLNGDAPPWTDDEILRAYKFCNVYRAADRVSQYMIRDVCYHGETRNEQDSLFQIVAFRLFSNILTWQSIHHFLGHHPTLRDLASGNFTKAIEDAKRRNGRLYTSAFILCAADAYGQPFKYLNHVELLRHMFLHDRLGTELLNCSSLREIYLSLRRYPLMGDFMSYQIAIDLNYSPLINFSENDFTQPGPGALRGIKKCFVDLGDYTPAEVVLWMVERQVHEFARLGLTFNGLWGRPLHAIDAQGLFCETDKYCREAVPTLASSRKRIKTKFAETGSSIAFFFPPKWGLKPSQ